MSTTPHGQLPGVIHEWLWRLAARQQLPACAAVLLDGDRTVFSKAYGKRRLDADDPATIDTPFAVASISKVVTGIAVMQLVQEGLVDLDDPIDRHLEVPDGTSDPVRSITVRQLATHTSGLPGGLPYVDPLSAGAATAADYLDALATMQLHPQPNRFKYSNYGFFLLGELVAAARGTSFMDTTRQRILEPLGMKSSRFAVPSDDVRATGYLPRHQPELRPAPVWASAQSTVGAAGLWSSATDLGAMARFLMDGNDDVLSDDARAEMLTVQHEQPDHDLRQAIGISYVLSGKHWYLGHGGATFGFRSSLLIDLERRRAAATVASCADAAPYDVNLALLRSLDGPDDIERVTRNALARTKPFTGVYVSPHCDIAVFQMDGKLGYCILERDTPNTFAEALEIESDDTLRVVSSKPYGTDGDRLLFQWDEDGTPTSVQWASPPLSYFTNALAE